MEIIKDILLNIKTVEGTVLIGAGAAVLVISTINLIPIIGVGLIGYGGYKVVTK